MGSPDASPKSTSGVTGADVEAETEFMDHRVPEGLVLGCLGISIRGVLPKTPVIVMHMGQIELIVAVAPNTVVEEHTRKHALCGFGPQWEERFSIGLNWPLHFNAAEFVNITVKTSEGTAVSAGSDFSTQLLAQLEGGGSSRKQEGCCNVPLKISNAIIEAIVEWDWSPWEMICVGLLQER